MARLKDTMVGDNAFGEGVQAPMVDLAQPESGQQGFRTNFEGYVSNAAYVRRNLIAVLIEAPRGFEDLPNSQKWVDTLKSLIELHSNSIEGLQSTLTAEFVENAVGGAGEMQEDVSNVTRARSTPTHVWTEKYGKPINAFLSGWITGLLMDPITKVPNVVANRDSDQPIDLLPDYTGATILYFEPDPTHTKVVHAWLCTNMHPKTAGEVVGNRDLTAAGESVNYSVEFTSLTQEGVGVNLFAQRVFDDMRMTGANPNLQQAFVRELDENVRSAENGYSEQIRTANNTSVS